MSHSSPFVVDWEDIEDVKLYALEISQSGHQMTVLRRPHEVTYNVILTSREEELKRDAEIIYRTP